MNLCFFLKVTTQINRHNSFSPFMQSIRVPWKVLKASFFCKFIHGLLCYSNVCFYKYERKYCCLLFELYNFPARGKRGEEKSPLTIKLTVLIIKRVMVFLNFWRGTFYGFGKSAPKILEDQWSLCSKNAMAAGSTFSV